MALYLGGKLEFTNPGNLEALKENILISSLDQDMLSQNFERILSYLISILQITKTDEVQEKAISVIRQIDALKKNHISRYLALAKNVSKHSTDSDSVKKLIDTYKILEKLGVLESEL